MELPFLSVYGRSSSVGWSVVRSVIWWVGWLVGRSVIISCYWSYTSMRRSECLVQFCIVAVLLFVANNRFCCQTGSNSGLSGWPSGSDQLSWRIFLTGGTEYATNFTQRLIIISRVDFVIILFLQAGQVLSFLSLQISYFTTQLYWGLLSGLRSKKSKIWLQQKCI